MISPDPNQTYISASELADFVYCKRQWWLQKNNLLQKDTTALNIGTEKHNQTYHDLTAYDKFKYRIILICIFFIILYLAFAIFLL